MSVLFTIEVKEPKVRKRTARPIQKMGNKKKQKNKRKCRQKVQR